MLTIGPSNSAQSDGVEDLLNAVHEAHLAYCHRRLSRRPAWPDATVRLRRKPCRLLRLTATIWNRSACLQKPWLRRRQLECSCPDYCIPDQGSQIPSPIVRDLLGLLPFCRSGAHVVLCITRAIAKALAPYYTYLLAGFSWLRLHPVCGELLSRVTAGVSLAGSLPDSQTTTFIHGGGSDKIQFRLDDGWRDGIEGCGR